MNDTLAIAPILLPLLGAALSILAWGAVRAQRIIALTSVVAVTAVSARLVYERFDGSILVSNISGWAPPFGIAIVVDLFSAVMVLLAGVTTLATVVYSATSVGPERKNFGYYPLLLTLLMGVNGAFTTGDLFNLYVWFEVMLMSSFVLMALGKDRAQIEGALKYVILNLFSSALFLIAVGLAYGAYGTLNFADLAQSFRASAHGAEALVALLLLIAFGIKAAAFPLFAWLPTSYHNPPIAVSALFAGLLTKVGVYALIRVMTLFFGGSATLFLAITTVALLTMIVGVLGAVAQSDTKRILSFHIVSQIGYMLLGLGIATPLAVAAAVFYIAHHIIVKANLFLIVGVAERLTGSSRLERSGGLAKRAPWLAALFLIPALSLAGIPPLSGFLAKFTILTGAARADAWGAVIISALVGILTLISMIKIWNEVFWKEIPADAPHVEPLSIRERVTLLPPMVMLVVLTISVTIFAPLLWTGAEIIAAQLIDPRPYISAVLGGAS